MWRDRMINKGFKTELIFRYDPVDNLFYCGLTTEIVQDMLNILTANDILLLRRELSEKNRGVGFVHRSDPSTRVFIIIMNHGLLEHFKKYSNSYNPRHVYSIYW